MLAAPAQRLGEIKGLGDAAITELKIVQAAAARMLKGEVKKRAVLSSWSSVLDYCRGAMAFDDKEQFRILFLDKRNHLIADEVQQEGTVDHTPVYPREVVKRALELSATAIILVHNHPSGDPTPSRADIVMTEAIVDVAKPLGILVHDHIIVGKDGHASLKNAEADLGALPPAGVRYCRTSRYGLALSGTRSQLFSSSCSKRQGLPRAGDSISSSRSIFQRLKLSRAIAGSQLGFTTTA